ncbi:MAG TPA: TIM barrel protein [Opitutaceae bacterium]|nr:TIM barrel protein [Opitutaceae bacterium]
MPSYRHSVSYWCFSKIPLAEFAKHAKGMGIDSIELLLPEDWPTIRREGLVCSVSQPVDTIPDSMNRRENHDRLIPLFEKRLKDCADAGVPNLVCFSGNRAGISDEEGLENTVAGYKKIIGIAERVGVTLCLELLNSKINHPDYQCDRSAWGVEVCKRISSERFKLLYDIYHMQVMEGDIIRTIREIHPYIAHYHTAGNPGRNEIDDSQELNYPAIMRAIQATGFTGYVGQEFVPTGDPLTSLREAIRICTV